MSACLLGSGMCIGDRIVIGLLAVTVMVSRDAGGVGYILEQAPEGSFQFFPDAGFTSWVNYFGAWIILGLGSIPSQDIYQRVMLSPIHI